MWLWKVQLLFKNLVTSAFWSWSQSILAQNKQQSRGLKAQTLEPEEGFESQLQLCDFGAVTSPLCASVSSSVKWFSDRTRIACFYKNKMHSCLNSTLNCAKHLVFAKEKGCWSLSRTTSSFLKDSLNNLYSWRCQTLRKGSPGQVITNTPLSLLPGPTRFSPSTCPTTQVPGASPDKDQQLSRTLSPQQGTQPALLQELPMSDVPWLSWRKDRSPCP